jgi:hypothetical protein
MYNVVFRNTSGNAYDGVLTWSTFKSKKDFDAWYDAKMKSWYQVVEESVSDERAIERCSTPEANQAAFSARMKKLGQLLLGR